MEEKDFISWCKAEIVKYIKASLDKTDNYSVVEDNIYVVWCCKTLQNNKALLSTNIPDGMYYECTYNGDKGELYLDAYKKWQNKCISLNSTIL